MTTDYYQIIWINTKKKNQFYKKSLLVGSAGILPAMARSVAEIADYQPF